MKVVFIILAIAVIGMVIAAFLPSRREATVSHEFKSSPEKIWSVITNNQDYSWRSDLKDVKADGPDNWIETPSHGPAVNFRVTLKKPFERYELQLSNDSFGGTWIGELSPLPGGGTKFVSTEKVETKGFVAKLMSYIFFSPQKTIERYFTDLTRKLGENS